MLIRSSSLIRSHLFRISSRGAVRAAVGKASVRGAEASATSRTRSAVSSAPICAVDSEASWAVVSSAIWLEDSAVGQALPRIDAAVRHIRQSAGRRHVSVTTFASFASMWLIPRLEAFQRDHPDIDIRIDAASLDTGFALRDDVLRGEDWFDSKAFPDILFRSDKLVFTGDTLSAVDGTLILRGEMRPLRLEINRFKCGLNLANRKRGCGADAQASLRRSDFGLTNGQPFIGDEVRLRIQVEAYLP